MRWLFITLLLAANLISRGQWVAQDIPTSTRYDDVFFLNDTLGWAAAGPAKFIYKTTNGGKTWEKKFTSEHYLRSIEFANKNLGFAGSLLGALYKTEDGGESWEDIAGDIPFSIEYQDETLVDIPGICGLSAPTSSVIYGCGIWSGGPAYVIKSTNGGASWTTTDMTPWATQLVDILFLNENEGFVTGMANPTTDGGIILYTDDGGANWEVVHKTMTNKDYIWKIQTPDSLHYFGSIEALQTTNDVRFVKSVDGGQNWNTKTVQENKWNYIQMIGFKDALHGWTGGTANSSGRETALFETTNGGETWEKIETKGTSTFNRFFMVNDTTIFLSGRKIYQYDPDAEINPSVPLATSQEYTHKLSIAPNPASEQLIITVALANQTRTVLEVLDQQGIDHARLHKGILASGEHQFILDIADWPGGLYVIALQTNEGYYYQKLIKK